jgi:hypothetical protein
MADAGAERTEGLARRGTGRVRGSPQAPRFVNRIPMRLPAPLQHRQAARIPPGAQARTARSSARHSQQEHGPLGARSIANASSRARVLPTHDVAAGCCDVVSEGAQPPNEKGARMRSPAISSLSTVSLEEALAYLDAANGDELGAAFTLAVDRNRLDGSNAVPDETEVHHALFLLRRARGLDAPSFDLMRIQLKRRVAA